MSGVDAWSVEVSSVQRRLSDYLQYELYHSLGAYSIARARLAKLEERLVQAHGPATGDTAHENALEQDELLRVTRISRRYNDQLARERHAAQHTATMSMPRELRHPIPDRLPLTLRARFEIEDDAPGVQDARRNPWASPMAWAWIINFYDAAIVATGGGKTRKKLREQNPQAAALAETFAKNVLWPRDRISGGSSSGADTEDARIWRRARFRSRRELSADLSRPIGHTSFIDRPYQVLAVGANGSARILDRCLGRTARR